MAIPSLMWPTSYDTNDTLFDPINLAKTELSVDITATTTPISVVDTSKFGDKNFIVIDDEIIYYEGKTTTQLGTSVCVRGIGGSVAAAHYAGAPVSINMIAEYLTRLRDGIKNIQTTFGLNPQGAYVNVNARLEKLDTRVATKIVAADGSGDYTSIQAGIDALPSSGSVLYIKEGIYEITSMILINGKNNISVIGAGKGTIIKVANGANVHALRTIFSDNVYFTNFTIDGNKLNQTSTVDGLYLVGENIVIENLYIKNVRGNGISLFSTTEKHRILNNHIYSCAQSGIRLMGGKHCILGNITSDHSLAGIELQDIQESSIIGNLCYSNTTDGILLKGTAANNVIANNCCQTNTGYGIREQDTANYNIILGNSLRLNTAGGLITVGANTEIGHNIT